MAFAISAVLSFILNTAILAAALWIIGEGETDPFKTDGAKLTLAKCAGVAAISVVCMFLPYGTLLNLLFWFAAVMVLFNKGFLSALLVAIVATTLSWLLGMALFALLN